MDTKANSVLLQQQANISCWQKDKEKMAKHIEGGGINPTTRHIHSVQHPELEAALVLWKG